MKKIVIILMIVCLISSCSNNKESRVQLFCMDTVMDLRAYGEEGNDAVKSAEEELKHLETLFDRKSDTSDIHNINSGKEVSEETEEILKKALEISAKTNGAFDITVSPVMDLWGFYDGNYSVPSDTDIKNALKSVNYKNIFFNNGKINILNNAGIDLGGIAKGYASDKVIDIFKDYGIKSAIINLGGNVFALGRRSDGKMWTVAITDPYDRENYALTLEVEDKAVITSGGYQRFFEENGKKYHHIIDPKTGYPAQSGIESVTVISSDATEADALSTALFVMGKDKAAEFLKKNRNIDAVIITDEKKIYYTPDLSEYIKIENNMDSGLLFDD